MSSNYQDISAPSKEGVLLNFKLMQEGHDFSTKYIPVYATTSTKMMNKPLVVSRPVVIRSDDMRSDDAFWRKD